MPVDPIAAWLAEYPHIAIERMAVLLRESAPDLHRRCRGITARLVERIADSLAAPAAQQAPADPFGDLMRAAGAQEVWIGQMGAAQAPLSGPEFLAWADEARERSPDGNIFTMPIDEIIADIEGTPAAPPAPAPLPDPLREAAQRLIAEWRSMSKRLDIPDSAAVVYGICADNAEVMLARSALSTAPGARTTWRDPCGVCGAAPGYGCDQAAHDGGDSDTEIATLRRDLAAARTEAERLTRMRAIEKRLHDRMFEDARAHLARVEAGAAIGWKPVTESDPPNITPVLALWLRPDGTPGAAAIASRMATGQWEEDGINDDGEPPRVASPDYYTSLPMALSPAPLPVVQPAQQSGNLTTDATWSPLASVIARGIVASWEDHDDAWDARYEVQGVGAVMQHLTPEDLRAIIEDCRRRMPAPAPAQLTEEERAEVRCAWEMATDGRFSKAGAAGTIVRLCALIDRLAPPTKEQP